MATRKKFGGEATPNLFKGGAKEDGQPEAKQSSSIAPGQCPKCRVYMPREFWRGRSEIPKVVHCIGSTSSWQKGNIPSPHHGRKSYGRCWRCEKYLGCDQCCGAPSQVLCMACGAWNTEAAFAEHGPVINTENMVRKRHGVRAPTFEEYPPNYQWHYREQNRNEPVAPTLEEWKAAPRPSIRTMPEPEPRDYDGDGIFAPPVK